MEEPTSKDRVCDRCGRWVEPNEVLYRARLEIFADPEIPEAQPAREREDLAREWDELIRRLEEMSEDEVREATDQVYEAVQFNLCPECRREMHRRIRSREDIVEGGAREELPPW